MEQKFDDAIKILLAMVRPNIQADHALKFTQAALNLSHAKQISVAVETATKTRTKGAGS